jgi:hypothetical protein
MAGFQKLEKKQVPQVIGLSIASCGLFGYFAYKMITPTASAAPVAAKQTATAQPSTSGASATTTASAAAVPDAPPPTMQMRDPFAPTVPLPTAAPTVAAAPAPVKVAAANIGTGLVSVPPAGLGPLPAMGSASGSSAASMPPTGPGMATGPAAPAPLAAPTWTVTGVLQSGAQSVAVLRNGDARAFAAPGQMVDADYRVVDVTRSFVVLRHGALKYTLPLGGPKTAPAAPQMAATSVAAPATSPAVVPAATPASQTPDPSQNQPQNEATAQPTPLVTTTPLGE